MRETSEQPSPESPQRQQQSAVQAATANDINRPKRNPFCSRCRNHGKSAQVKGHKRHCEYRDCQCEGCKLVQCRQLVSAAQIRRRRYQKQDEECGRRIEVSPPVLERHATGNDPASLISKTLTCSTVRRSSSSISSTTTAPTCEPNLMRLVDEIQQTYGGAQVIYAWLKAERFDVQRVRNLIEASRPSFATDNDRLMIPSTGQPLNTNHNNNNTTNNLPLNSPTSAAAIVTAAAHQQHQQQHQTSAWPSALKLPSMWPTGSSSGSLIPPYLLPHLMHHHHQSLLAQNHQAQQQQHLAAMSGVLNSAPGAGIGTLPSAMLQATTNGH